MDTAKKKRELLRSLTCDVIPVNTHLTHGTKVISSHLSVIIVNTMVSVSVSYGLGLTLCSPFFISCSYHNQCHAWSLFVHITALIVSGIVPNHHCLNNLKLYLPSIIVSVIAVSALDSVFKVLSITLVRCSLFLSHGF